jgi:hypothetical protein
MVYALFVGRIMKIGTILVMLLSVCSVVLAQEALFEYPRDLERDPFDALVNADGVLNVKLVRQEGDLVLNGVLFSPVREERVAIINGQMLKEKASIGSYEIAQIEKETVVLVKGDKEITLKMGGQDEAVQ